MRLPPPGAGGAWAAALHPAAGQDVVYLAPGDDVDDDPGVALFTAGMTALGRSVERVGAHGVHLDGLTVAGPATADWRPDPGKSAWVRGIADAATLRRWLARLDAEYGPTASPEVRPWHAAAWSSATPAPAADDYPVGLRVRPTEASRARATERLRDVIQTLRSPDGCPWDREQTHASLRPYLIEEAYEAVAAIESGDAAELSDELGDVLLQVALHAEIGRQGASFAWPDVIEAITTKMIRRHPHVFGDAVAEDAAAVLKNWSALKVQEREGVGDGLADLPATLPALALAREIVTRLRSHGNDLDLPTDLAGAVAESLAGAGDAEALGDALVALVAEADRRHINVEMAVRDASLRLRRRGTPDAAPGG